MTSCKLNLATKFHYGNGESFVFTFHKEFKVIYFKLALSFQNPIYFFFFFVLDF